MDGYGGGESEARVTELKFAGSGPARGHVVTITVNGKVLARARFGGARKDADAVKSLTRQMSRNLKPTRRRKPKARRAT